MSAVSGRGLFQTIQPSFINSLKAFGKAGTRTALLSVGRRCLIAADLFLCKGHEFLQTVFRNQPHAQFFIRVSSAPCQSDLVRGNNWVKNERTQASESRLLVFAMVTNYFILEEHPAALDQNSSTENHVHKSRFWSDLFKLRRVKFAENYQSFQGANYLVYP